MDADQATFGRFIESGPTSYEQVARANGTAQFNLEGDGWERRGPTKNTRLRTVQGIGVPRASRV